MLKTGNGTPQNCVENLLKIFRGEVPYARAKGLDPRMIDRPLSDTAAISQDAEWLIETYEPRAILDGIEVIPSDAVNGGFRIKANLK